MKHSKFIKNRQSLKLKGVETKKIDHSTKSNEQLGVLFYILDDYNCDIYGYYHPLDEFKDVLNFQNQFYDNPLSARQSYQALIYDLIKDGAIDNRMFSQILEQYLATFEVVPQALVKYPNQSFGITVTLNLNNKDNPLMMFNDFITWKSASEEVLKYYNETYLNSLRN